jgi:uncharacterized coiled-coil protein SlyX
MSISKRVRHAEERQAGPQPPAWRRRTLNALALALALAFIPELIRARAGAAFEPHPAWIAVLIMAARDGGAGLFTGLIAVAGAVTVGSAVAGTGLVVWDHLDSGPNLAAFAACLIVSWVASWHLRRQEDLSERVRVLSDRAAEAKTTIDALMDAVATLRARVDRTSTSLSFLRDVAARLEGTDPAAAAEGAADLVLARTGAHAVGVKVGMGGSQRLLTVRDARGPKMLAPLEFRDAEHTVSIRNGNDRIGTIALWGIDRSELDDATAHDLDVIASWCAPALAIEAWRPAEQESDRVRRIH